MSIKRILAGIGLGILLIASLFGFYFSYLDYQNWHAPQVTVGYDLGYGIGVAVSRASLMFTFPASIVIFVLFIILSVIFYKKTRNPVVPKP